MKKTFEQINQFNTQADLWIKKAATNANTKLGYALTKIGKGQINSILREYAKAYRELYYNHVQKGYIDNALTNKVTGEILMSPKGSSRPYLFSPEGLAKVVKIENDFQETQQDLSDTWEEKEFDITPYIAVEVPEDLTDVEREAFKGFVLE